MKLMLTHVLVFISCCILCVFGREPFFLCTTPSGDTGYCHTGDPCRNGFSASADASCLMRSGLPNCCPLKSNLIRVTPKPLLKGNEVGPPLTKLQCGKRGFIGITFGLFASGVPLPSSFLARRKRASTIGLEVGPKLPEDEDIRPIVGGEQSFKNSWPWMVLLGRHEGRSTNFFCSGVLINNQYVLTAAHCVTSLTPYFARLGEHDYTVSGGSSRAPEDVTIADTIFHPKYDINRGYYDMALLKLSRPLTIRNEIKPICLPWGSEINQDLTNSRVTVTGWGTLSFGGPSARVLQEVQVTVFEPSVCAKSYSTLPGYRKEFPDGMNRDNILCAGDRLGGKDTCQGDSGGPMISERPGSTYTLVGIISQGYGCGKAEFPGLYAPLRNFDTLTWIKKTAF